MAQIKGYEGLYEIYENGKIVNLQTGNELKGNINAYGYRVVRLTKDKKHKDYKVHQLLAKAFLPNPNNYRCINHNKVVESVSEMLSEKGITITELELKMLVEATVGEFNKVFETAE